MAKPEIKVVGTVPSEPGHGYYLKELGNGHRGEATLGSNLKTKRRNHFRPPRSQPMDAVLLVLSPMDLMGGRITEPVTKRNPPT